MRLRALFFFAVLSLFPGVSHALSCSISGVQPINFGNVNPLSSTGAETSMTFSYSCSKVLTDVLSAITLCFNIGASSNGQTNPHGMSFAGPPASTLNYQLYQNQAHTVIWGNQNQAGTPPPMAQIALLNLTPVTGSLTVYAKLTTPQITAAPGSYLDVFNSATASVTTNTGLALPPADCGNGTGPSFPFNVTAVVTKQCNISFVNNISIGPVTMNQSNIGSSNTLGVACSNNTPYSIGLSPSNGSTTGSGQMKTSGSGSNTDLVLYQLRSTSGQSGTPWGSITANSVNGTGTGSTTAYTVYATVPNANYAPDNYADTVTINVTY